VTQHRGGYDKHAHANTLAIEGLGRRLVDRVLTPVDVEQFPSVPSLTLNSRTTCAIGRDVSITIFTASSRYAAVNLFFTRAI
jgi:hypothetical protein